MDILNVTRIFLTIPFPPVSGNHMWKRSGRAVYLVQKARDYYGLVAHTVRANSHAVGFSSALRVSMAIYPPDKRKRDITNTLKVVEDSLTRAGVWADDSLIFEMNVKKKSPDKTCPRIEIEVEVI